MYYIIFLNILSGLNFEKKISKDLLKLNEEKIYDSLRVWIYYLFNIYRKLDSVKKIVEGIHKINLKKPQIPYISYFLDTYENYDKNLSFINLHKKIHREWDNLPEMEKSKYEKKFEYEKMRYDNELILVCQYLFLALDENINFPKKLYSFAETEKRLDMFLNNSFIKEDLFIKNVSDFEKNLTQKEFAAYTDYWAANFYIFGNAKIINDFNVYNLFENDFIKENNLAETKNNFNKIKKLWRDTSLEIKILYNIKYNFFKRENEFLYNVYNFINNIPPRKPQSPFVLFCEDLKSLFSTYNDCSIYDKIYLWNNLKLSLKIGYKLRYKRLVLAYDYRKYLDEKMNKNIKNIDEKKENENIESNSFRILSKEEKDKITNLKELRNQLYKKEKKAEDYLPDNTSKKFRNFVKINSNYILQLNEFLGINSVFNSAKIYYQSLTDMEKNKYDNKENENELKKLEEISRKNIEEDDPTENINLNEIFDLNEIDKRFNEMKDDLNLIDSVDKLLTLI